MLFPLINPIQNYAWGSRTAIAELCGRQSPSSEPEAELWLGAHPKAPSRAGLDGQVFDLRVLIEDRGEEMLGRRCLARFGTLPFLMKLLAAAQPLSIQAHPTREQAEVGFARERTAGVPLTSGACNYRDKNHKPEIICALTPIAALSGFREPKEAVAMMRACGLDAMGHLCDQLAANGDLQAFLPGLLTMPEAMRPQLLAEVSAAADSGLPNPEIAGWLRRLGQAHPTDVGIVAPLFLNLVTLSPGEALATEAGVLHAYLEGCGIELMANSDNVLRGGLTAKHVDVPELLRCLDFAPRKPLLPQPLVDGSETVYAATTAEFQLSRLELTGGAVRRQPTGPEILLCTGGEATVADGVGPAVVLASGEAVFVAGSTEWYAAEGRGTLFRASVPNP